MRELPAPAIVDSDAVELVRIFRQADGNLIFAVRRPRSREPMADPGSWGLIAVDLLHHVANLMVESGLHIPGGARARREEILERARRMFDAEWDNRTDEARRVYDG